MAKRNQFVRLFRRHDTGDAGGAEHVAFLSVACEHEIERRRRHEDAALGDRHASRRGLGGDVDHARFAALGEMG
jgi:hypothetical protein